MTIAEKITRAKADYDAVYEAGKAAGGDTEAAYNEGFEQGKSVAYTELEPLNAELEQTLYGTDTGGKSFYDEFWDAYQYNGNRTHYAYAFGGLGWAKVFKPKYNIIPEYATNMFYQCGATSDLVSRLESLGVTLDLSHALNADYVFYASYFSRIGVVDLTSTTKMAYTFAYCNNLRTVDKVMVTENCTYSNPFLECPNLENVTFEGVIAKNGLNLRWSTKLSKASFISVIEHLSTTTSGLTVTFSKTAKEAAFTDDEWATLVATRPNWTISLV